jgi:hypothetical protein
MARGYTSLVVGFHGCERSVGERIVRGETPFQRSTGRYDWLGEGVYFWDSDEQRALEWALWKQSVGQISDPCVIGAIFTLGNCLDLSIRENLDLLALTYDAYVVAQQAAGLPIPINRDSSKGASQNKVMRALDCAVINFLHSSLAARGQLPFDSVRGLFVEGGPAYPGAEIYRLTHAQIAVLNEDNIRGVFHPRG